MITLEKQALNIRRLLVNMIAHSKSSHIGTGLSMVDILTTLYFKTLNIDLLNPTAIDRDFFILSKAHGSAALYATLASRGFFPVDDLSQYYVDGGKLPGHLDRLAAPGVETSGGSLGHGLGLAIGVAMASKMDNQTNRVITLLGDGECNEGSVWEGVMLAPNLKLDNLTMIIDFNFIQSLGNTNDIIDQSNLCERLQAFGWDAVEIDGHDFSQIERALNRKSSAPQAIVAKTVKGKGISFMEGKLLWHYRSPNPDELEKALEELK